VKDFIPEITINATHVNKNWIIITIAMTGYDEKKYLKVCLNPILIALKHADFEDAACHTLA
jgi:hypothetical protein